MAGLIALLENIAPGLRDLRPPLFSGLLWAVTAWVYLTLQGEPVTDNPFWPQVTDVSSAIGATALLLIGAALMFALGALTYPVSLTLSRLTERALAAAEDTAWWWATSKASANALVARRDEMAADEPLDEKRQKELEKLDDQLRAAGVQGSLGFWNCPPKNTEPVRAALGIGGRDESAQLKNRILVDAAEAAYDLAVDEFDSNEDFHMYSSVVRQYRVRLDESLGSDPLDALRSLDAASEFNALDRARAEREVRLAIAVPAAALCLVLAEAYSPIWLLGALACSVVFLSATRQGRDEEARVLNVIALTRLELPAVRSLKADIRRRVRSDAADEFERQASQRAQQEQVQQAQKAERERKARADVAETMGQPISPKG